MKICLISRTFGLKGGGIGRVSLGVRDGLKTRGHEVYTVESKGTGLASYFKYTAFDLAYKIPKNMDIYHALTPMESIWVPKGRGVPVILDIIGLTHPERYGGRLTNSITTFHDIFTSTHPGKIGAGLGYNKLKMELGRKYFEFACRQALKCKYVVTVSGHVKDEVCRYFGVDKNRVRVIKSGIREDLNPSKKDGPFRVGYLGQLDKRKRIDLLIRAFKKSNFEELVIAGRGVDEVQLRELGLEDKRIKFLGLIPDERLKDFYNSLDVLIFPTAIEGYGLPPVEAMACRKPTVLLEDAIIPKEIKDRCIVTDNLEAIFSNNKRYLKSRMAYIDYNSNYKFAKEHSWDKCIDEYLELYEEILSE